MGIRRLFKTPNGDFMMNCICWLPAHFAFSIRSANGFSPSRPPSTSPRSTVSTSPSRVVFTPIVDGLPFGHTLEITKNFLRMKIRRRPFYLLPAPWPQKRIFCRWGKLDLVACLPSGHKDSTFWSNTVDRRRRVESQGQPGRLLLRVQPQKRATFPRR